MKRLVAMMLVAAFTFAMAAQASALEVNVKGNFHFSFRWSDKINPGAQFKEGAEDNFLARQRMRLQVDFVASENLKGVLYLHSKGGNYKWGSNGAALDTTSETLYVRHAYIDWNVADTGLNVKMGLQQVTSPGFAGGSTFTNDAMAGITLSNKFSDNVAASLGWYRLYNGSAVKDAVDMFMVMVPMTFDGFKITPWGEYTFIGRDAAMYEQGGTDEKKSKMWHLGVATEFNPIDPLTIALDATYGAIDASGDDPEADGFMIVGRVYYDVDFAKLQLGAWYASGNDKKDVAKNEYGMMPNLLGSPDGDPGFNMTGLGFWGNNTPLAGTGILSKSGVGTWGVMVGMKDLSFVTDLTHELRVAYYEGTSDKETRDDTYGVKNDVFMTEKDSAIEVNFDTKYQIAKGFTMGLDAGIVFMDWESKHEKGNKDLDDTMWRVVFGVQYAF